MFPFSTVASVRKIYAWQDPPMKRRHRTREIIYGFHWVALFHPSKDWRSFKSAIFPSLPCWRQLRAGGSKGFDLFKDWNPPLQLCSRIIQLMHAGMCHQLCIVPLLIHSFAGSCIGCCSEEILPDQRQKCITSPALIPFQWTHISGEQQSVIHPSC